MYHAFDIDRAVQESGLPAETIEEIVRDVRKDFREDDVLYELKVIRAIQAEQAARISPSEWVKSIRQEADSALDAHGMERAQAHSEPAPRIRPRSPRRRQAG